MGTDNFKGLRIYMAMVVAGLAFFAYSQWVGWKWLWATKTSPPTEQQGTGSYRYLRHK